MSSNSFGEIFKIHTFGESHGNIIGAVIDGCPAGVIVDEALLQGFMNARRPGQNHLTTSRQESDIPTIDSGIFEGKTTGAPIIVSIKNENTRPQDYDAIKDIFRPSHADYTFTQKYGIRDYRGGGRSSARTTAAWSIGGAFAAMLLKSVSNIEICAYVYQIYQHKLSKKPSWQELQNMQSTIQCPSQSIAKKMEKEIEKAKKNGDSLGGIVGCIIKNCPPGLGEPQSLKLQAMLAKAMLSINAAKGFEYGAGFDAALYKGSELNDEILKVKASGITTLNNHSGGILGGISNGENIDFKVAFKPTATIASKQNTINIEGEKISIAIKGRHDPCVVPRACALVSAMAWLVMADAYLLAKLSKL